jgi:hypothetical protein
LTDPYIHKKTGKMPDQPSDVIERAKFERERGHAGRALALLNEYIATCERTPNSINENAYRMAHIELYKAHKGLGHDRLALTAFNKAIQLGARLKDLET